ncbi:MAG: phosphopantetheine-binding protein [Potamolinea sp.]
MQLAQVEIQSAIVHILQDMTQEWDLDLSDINPETKLVEDLNFGSIDIIHLVVAIEEHFQKKLGFNELLMKNGQYVEDITIEDLVSFVSHKL